VREVCRHTGADIKSWTDQTKDEATRTPRPTRTFVIEVGCPTYWHASLLRILAAM